MAHLKVLNPAASNLSDLLEPLPTEEELLNESIEDPTEKRARLVLKGRVEEQIRHTTQNNIVFPPNLLDQVADHVLYLSKDEACGLRGCVIVVFYEEPEEPEQLLAKVKADRSMPSTHLLVLRLKPDPASWYTKMARIFRSLGGKRRMIISPSYELTKRTFYE
ncbi:hypothetical protein OTU49_007957 [Cherax quadricarinatus]|uniref:Uncharacterized protein n=1 Tax=Cherax quadricarinatus TaxID=27406 RepID=A0AAW0YM33_CHEQU|nr:DNA damage-inducible transcript 4-like protein [Cherax quadricarinatus]